MLGLIKKDFLLIKANLKSMIIIFVIYIMLAFQGTLDVTFIIPLIGIILFLSTFSYDDFNNWKITTNNSGQYIFSYIVSDLKGTYKDIQIHYTLSTP